MVQGERGRIEGDPLLVRARAVPDFVVDALIEHTERADGTALVRLAGEQACGQLARKARFPRDSAGGHRGDSTQWECLTQIPDGPWRAVYAAFGLAVDGADERRTDAEEVLEPPGLAFVDPAAFLPDALDGLHVLFHVEVAKGHGCSSLGCGARWPGGRVGAS